jgi:hypothetical protein
MGFFFGIFEFGTFLFGIWEGNGKAKMQSS